MWDFPGGPVVKTPPFNAGCVDLIPGLGAKIPHALWPKKKKKKKYKTESNNTGRHKNKNEVKDFMSYTYTILYYHFLLHFNILK